MGTRNGNGTKNETRNVRKRKTGEMMVRIQRSGTVTETGTGSVTGKGSGRRIGIVKRSGSGTVTGIANEEKKRGTRKRTKTGKKKKTKTKKKTKKKRLATAEGTIRRKQSPGKMTRIGRETCKEKR